MTDPRRTALLLIECQRGVVGDLSFMKQLAGLAGPMLANVGRLAAGARAAGVQVAHLTYRPLLGGRSANQRARLMAAQSRAGWAPDDGAAEVVPEVGLADGDIVLERHQGISPIHRTETLAILRNAGIEEVVVAGVSTNIAIPLVAVAAVDEGFTVTVPADATMGVPAEHHESMLTHTVAFVARMTSVDDLLKEWSAG